MPINQNIKTSFIPNKPIQAVGKGGGLRTKKKSNFFGLVGLVVFIATLAGAAGVYLYEIGLENKIEKQEEQLQTARQSFDADFIAASSRLDDRIESVKGLLDGHTSPSQVFELLEDTTLTTVQFENFNYSTKDDDVIAIQANGLASGFQSVVLQSDNYGDTGYLRSVLFSGLQNDPVSGVTFDLNGTVDRAFILYRNSLVQASDDDDDDDDDSAGESFEFPGGDNDNEN